MQRLPVRLIKTMIAILSVSTALAVAVDPWEWVRYGFSGALAEAWGADTCYYPITVPCKTDLPKCLDRECAQNDTGGIFCPHINGQVPNQPTSNEVAEVDNNDVDQLDGPAYTDFTVAEQVACIKQYHCTSGVANCIPLVNRWWCATDPDPITFDGYREEKYPQGEECHRDTRT